MATLNQRQKRQTYWNSGRMSPALQRARQPFRAKNLAMGAGILSFTFGVYMYSIAAVKQDDFSDVPAPSMEQIQQINRAKEKLQAEEQQKVSSLLNSESLQPPTATLPPIGLLGSTAHWVRGLNSESQVVLGAPPINQIGKINDRKVVETDRKLV